MSDKLSCHKACWAPEALLCKGGVPAWALRLVAAQPRAGELVTRTAIREMLSAHAHLPAHLGASPFLALTSPPPPPSVAARCAPPTKLSLFSFSTYHPPAPTPLLLQPVGGTGTGTSWGSRDGAGAGAHWLQPAQASERGGGSGSVPVLAWGRGSPPG